MKPINCPARGNLPHHWIHPNDDAQTECLFCRATPQPKPERQPEPETPTREGVELVNLQHIL